VDKDNQIDEAEFKAAFGKYFGMTNLLEEMMQDGGQKEESTAKEPAEVEEKEEVAAPTPTGGVLHVRTRKFVYSEELTKACTYQVRLELRNATTGDILEKFTSEPFISKNELNACVLECACTKAFTIST
jgi:hypothetical protein